MTFKQRSVGAKRLVSTTTKKIKDCLGLFLRSDPGQRIGNEIAKTLTAILRA